MTSTSEVIRLLEQAKVEEALSKADGVGDRKKMSEKLSDFAARLSDTSGHHHLACAILFKSIKLDPENAEALYNLGNAYAMPWMIEENPGYISRALECYDLALSLKPDLLEARYNKALLQALTGDVSSAKLEYEKLTGLNPKHPKFKELELIFKDVEK